MRKTSGLTKGEREMIVVATSARTTALLRVAHGAILRIHEKNPLVADQVAVNYRKADITPRQQRDARLRDEGLPNDSRTVGEADYAALREHGFTDDDIWDIGAIAALFALSNRMANCLAMRPNDEFYAMGR